MLLVYLDYPSQLEVWGGDLSSLNFIGLYLKISNSISFSPSFSEEEQKAIDSAKEGNPNTGMKIGGD